MNWILIGKVVLTNFGIQKMILVESSKLMKSKKTLEVDFLKKIVSFNSKSLFNGDIEKFISELKLFSKYFGGKWVGYFDYEDFRYFGNNFE